MVFIWLCLSRESNDMAIIYTMHFKPEDFKNTTFIFHSRKSSLTHHGSGRSFKIKIARQQSLKFYKLFFP